MNTSFAKGLTRSASKRARPTDSPGSGASTPVPKALKTQEHQVSSDISVPAFLCQSASEIRAKFTDLEHQQLFRVAEGRRDPTSRWAQDNTKQTRLRNRYVNVQPWDKSRIHLQVPEGESDYINASPIALTDPQTGAVFSYIAAQGPKETGSSHFWHMIWQQTSEVGVIVMLTPTVEGGREKCFQYFPMNEETGAISIEPIDGTDSAHVGSIQVSELSFDEACNSTVRKLLLTFGEESKVIWHILFSGWPDFEVPQNEDRAALFELLKLSSAKNTNPSNPRIIHCSAGVGRSGSFIALEYLLAQIKSGALEEANEDEDPIYDTVNQLREQRMTMVQSDAQYAFLYEVVREEFVKSQNTAQQCGLQELASGIKAALGDDAHEDPDHMAGNDHNEKVMDSTGKAPVIP
ncbi:MAG: hypothetical protein LQ343_002286 [Gyalolechia ehrenbergii]|nr:MAG: hypothetical protein LQ343_002286 [Gyalolechia ehrenbergii]